MSRGRLQVAALFLLAPLIVSCADDSADPLKGDCSPRIGWAGAVYSPNNQLKKAAPHAERLGTGDVLDCEMSSMAQVEVYAIVDVNSSLAIEVISGDWHGIYMVEGLPESRWPHAIMKR